MYETNTNNTNLKYLFENISTVYDCKDLTHKLEYNDIIVININITNLSLANFAKYSVKPSKIVSIPIL
jgi:hypothetical protein